MYKVDMTSQDNIQTDVFESNISRLDNRNQLSSVLINKKNELSPHYKRLIDFLKEYKVKKGETENYESIRNFCNLAIKQNYAIPDNRIPKLMDLLETCRINDLRLNFTEYQNEKSSGIMYDFDILLKEEKSVVPFIKFDELITSIVDVFFNTINFRIPVPDDFDSQLDEEARLTKHAVIIKKTALVYKEDSKKYKDGFHLIFPDIKISRNFKKFLLKQIMTNTNIATQFSKLGLKLNEVLDTHSASVPLFLYGSSKVGGVPYELHEMYYFNIYSNRVEDVRTVDIASYTNCNLVYDFSLNHKFERGIIKEKTRYLPQEAVSNDIEIFNDHHKYKFDDNELNEVNRDITLKNLYIPDIDYMQAILSILSVERLSNYDTWLKLIIALANTSHDYKELAIWISKRVPEKWDPVLFENTWNNIINSKTEDGNKLSIRSIEYWAKEDNPAKRKELQDKSIIQLINDDIYDTFICGDLQQKQFAKYLHHMFKHKFITDIKYKERTHSWFEFMLPTDDHQGSNLFKWRDEDKSPDSLLMYLGEKFIYILKEIYDQISQRIDDESDTIMLKYLTTIKKNLQKCVKKLFTPKFKSDIIKEAGLMFRKRGFIDSLDKDKHLLGVENGILDLNNIELINYYHDYPVTCSTGIRYIPYDSTNRYIIEIEQVIRNLFPDDEMDVHEFLMYYIASCLDGKPKQSIILIITGIGCHSIDTPILMYDGTIKKVQDIELNDKLMGDDNTPRTVQELFRGNEQMVEIIPRKEKSFKVNMNHILSLKFTNLITITKINIQQYCLVWYLRNNNEEPIKITKSFKTYEDAKEYMKSLYNDLNIIQENDIIDIKVNKLLKWNPSWVDQNKICLYKFKNTNLYKFKIKILDNDNFYGFELDGNHRYLTGDYFVHHNSNGKSFFFEFAKSILGPKYGIKMELAFLVDKRKKSGGPDPSLMALEHGRLAHYSETEQNEELNTARMKEITGQESLAGRNLFEAQKNFRPCCHHLITCNHHLSIRTTDHGTWRRIKTYKFKIVFGLNPDPNNKYERKSDPKVAEEYATDARYKEAFLSIIVEYYKKLQSKYNGNILNIPCETIAKETDEYRHNEDIISKFIDSRAVVSTNNTTSILDVVEIYKIWYIDNVGNNMTQNNQQLSNIILNSKLCKYFKTENKTYTLKGVRILGKNETPVQKEKFLSEVL